MTVKLLTEQHLEFLSLKGGCTGSSVSIHVKMPHFLKSYVTAQVSCIFLCYRCERKGYEEGVCRPSHKCPSYFTYQCRCQGKYSENLKKLYELN